MDQLERCETSLGKRGMLNQPEPKTDTRLTKRTRVGRLYRGKEPPMLQKNTKPNGLLGLVPPLLLEAPKRAVKLLVLLTNLLHSWSYLFFFLVEKSASNDFWGKTFLNLSGESKMTQNISILTGCSAGATVSDLKITLIPYLTLSYIQESFVVVPFELVKIKSFFKISTQSLILTARCCPGSKIRRVPSKALWTC